MRYNVVTPSPKAALAVVGRINRAGVGLEARVQFRGHIFVDGPESGAEVENVVRRLCPGEIEAFSVAPRYERDDYLEEFCRWRQEPRPANRTRREACER